MSGDAAAPATVRVRGGRIWSQGLRVLAWGTLLGATGWLLRAEVERPSLPQGVVAYPDLVYRQVGDRQARLDLYAPAEPPPSGGRPAVLAIHGGGWRGGSKADYGRMAAVLAQRGYVVAAIDYRLSKPGAPSWPDNVADVRAAVRWLRRHAAEYGVNPGRIVAMGASAGGHLAALLGTLPEAPRPRDEPGRARPAAAPDAASDSARVQAVIDFYGTTDLAALAEHRQQAPRRPRSLRGRLTPPIHHAR
jgi:acetyl esterase/lipase